MNSKRQSRWNWLAPTLLLLGLLGAAFGADAIFNHSSIETRVTLQGALGGGEIWQLADGRAAFYDNNAAASSGDRVYIRTEGQVSCIKTNGVVILDGGCVYWDHSANSATFEAVNDRDFYLGTAIGDWAAGDTQMLVNLNVKPAYHSDLSRGWSDDGFISAKIGTVAVTGCNIFRNGSAHNFVHNSTSEAQKLDLLAVNGFAPGANWIIEGAFRVPSDGAGTVVDVNLGIASATHATDADSIAEHLFIHLDANATPINIQSKDGTTTVTATDTTLDYTEGSALSTRVEFWLDGRNPADIQCYINGVLTLGATTFRLDNAVGPLFLIAHTEKTSAADAYEISVDWLRVRIAEQ